MKTRLFFREHGRVIRTASPWRHALTLITLLFAVLALFVLGAAIDDRDASAQHDFLTGARAVEVFEAGRLHGIEQAREVLVAAWQDGYATAGAACSSGLREVRP